MPLNQLYQLVNEAQTFWRPGVSNRKSEFNRRKKCPQCDREFKGRPNKVYCTTRCKDLAGRQRKRAKELITRETRRTIAEQEAMTVRDQDDINYIRACRAKEAPELSELLTDNNLKDDPEFIREVHKLLEHWAKVGQKDAYQQIRRKTKLSFSDKLAAENHHDNTTYTHSFYKYGNW